MAHTASACAKVEPVAAPTAEGRTASEVTARLGPPEIQPQSDGRTVYVWRLQTRAPATPVPSITMSYAAGRPNVVDTLSYPEPPQMQTCTLRAFVDGASRIGLADWDGTNAACFAMKQRLILA